MFFHNKLHLREMDVDKVQAYIAYLANERCVATSTQNQVPNAIVFWYKYVLQNRSLLRQASSAWSPHTPFLEKLFPQTFPPLSAGGGKSGKSFFERNGITDSPIFDELTLLMNKKNHASLPLSTRPTF